MSKHALSEDIDEIYNNADLIKHPPAKRAKEVDENKPFEELEEQLASNKSSGEIKNVLHWFRSKDIRQEDNKGLNAASEKAQDGKGILITAFLYSPGDLQWHGTSPARCDFMLESIRLLQKQLAEKSIPLVILTAEERADKTDVVVNFVKENNISHVFGNYEYEVDELHRDIKVAKHLEAEGVSFELFHDQTAVAPLSIVADSGKPHRVFTPYHKAWLAELQENSQLLDLVEPPKVNDKVAEKYKRLFDSKIPALIETKHLASKEEQERIRKLWPAGNAAGMQRLDEFLNKKVKKYAKDRSNPAGDATSRMSPYFSSGVVSVREVLARTKKWNGGGDDFEGRDPGVASWVREIVFREFYRQMLVLVPHGSMNLPQNIKFDKVTWEDDEDGWRKWCEGTTGVPFVDAGMRQLNHEAYMHNRLRMNVSSYLSGNLLIDYRKGERWFVEHLVDWDLANNTQGWEPSYTIFNPVIQGEKCDPNGDYIRKWVPELKNVQGKAIFDPASRLTDEEYQELCPDYPKPHVDFKETSQRAKERYKRDLHTPDD